MIHFLNRVRIGLLLSLTLILAVIACNPSPDFDVLIKNGTIVDGTGKARYQGDIGINGEKIAAIGELDTASATKVINAEGLVVSPGFINMLSWAANALMNDGRSMSDIKQGVTLEVFGEGSSLGPVSPEEVEERDLEWQTFGEGLEYLVSTGITPNVASFVGATTIRTTVIGYEDRPPTPEELEKMKQLVRRSMQEGALGVGSSLIYAPAWYASTEELIALASAAGEYGGMYISHMRSEGNNLIEAVDELVRIAKEADVPAQIYHLKAAGKSNWYKLPIVLHKIDSLRAAGLSISADMYTYTAASTGLDATMPPWVQEGGTKAWLNRLSKPEIQKRVLKEMNTNTSEWENFLQLADDPDNILLLEFNPDSLNKYVGKTLGEVARERGTSPAQTIIDLVLANGGDISCVYFLMSKENVRLQMQKPYVSFASDAQSVAAEGEILKSSRHPRAYGNFARLLGKFVREEKILTLEEAVHRMTGLAAKQLHIKQRGLLNEGYKADIVIFDPATIADKATYTQPHQYSVGVKHVFVNGIQVLKNGEHTGAMPGEFVRGPGYSLSKEN